MLKKLTSLKLKSKKGGMGLQSIYPTILTFVLVGIILAVGLLVLAEIMGEMTVNSTAETAVNDTIVALASFSGWFGIIILVIVAAIIIGLVMKSFTSR